ncbi:MAG: hypothetical protein ABL929_07300 [Ferruginibacter sp.]
MLNKTLNIRFKNSNSQPYITAHLQGTQTQRTEPNLAKELQLPTHGNQFSIQRFTQNLFKKLKQYKSLRENKSKQKNKELRPLFFQFATSLFVGILKITL